VDALLVFMPSFVSIALTGFIFACLRPPTEFSLHRQVVIAAMLAAACVAAAIAMASIVISIAAWKSYPRWICILGIVPPVCVLAFLAYFFVR